MNNQEEFEEFDSCPEEYELDFCTAINLILGMSYQDAVKQARFDVQEARDPS